MPLKTGIDLNPLRAALAIMACNYNNIAVRITKPQLSVGWGRIEVGLRYDLRAQRASLVDGLIKILHLEPEYDAVRQRSSVPVDKVRVIFLVPSMELKNDTTITEHPIIEIAMDVL